MAIYAQTQMIVVNSNKAISIVNAGPIGPAGPQGDLNDNDIGVKVASQASVDGKVSKSGDTMDGDLMVTNTVPSVVLHETDQAVDNGRVAFRHSGGVVRIDTLRDSGARVGTPFHFTRSNGKLNLNGDGVSSLVVPVATVPESAARKEDVDAKVSKTGDTMSGNLEIANSNPRYFLTDTNASVDRGKWDFFAANDGLYLRALTDAGASRANWLHVGPNLEVQFPAATSLKVPANTAVGQAAQITAFDPATGRLAIGGREMGHTPWVGGSTWPLLNGWTCGYFRYQRVQSETVVEIFALDGSAATLDVFFILPPGYRGNIGTQPYFIGSEAGVAATPVGISHVPSNGTLLADRLTTSAMSRGTIRIATDQDWPSTVS